MGEIVIDDYPLRRWLVVGSTELPHYSVLKEYLVNKYKVCYFCSRPVKIYPHSDGESAANDSATIDHLKPRQYRKRYELSLKVLSCWSCNQVRNMKEQKTHNTLREREL